MKGLYTELETVWETVEEEVAGEGGRGAHRGMFGGGRGKYEGALMM